MSVVGVASNRKEPDADVKQNVRDAWHDNGHGLERKVLDERRMMMMMMMWGRRRERS